MSLKFRSSSARNKTPPVCQKHNPGPDLPRDVQLPSVRGLVIFTAPTVAPSEIWTINATIPLVGPGNFYRLNTTDSDGRIWTIIASFSASYIEWDAAAFLTLPPTPPTAFNFAPKETFSPYPLNTNLWVAQGFSNCQNAEWQFTA